ncbi:MAG: 6-bladed beta-propeller [Gemmatimonadetes bacterium]|nr:6-bladed beta-propeller [Gemmatimonadota bacterium]
MKRLALFALLIAVRPVAAQRTVHETASAYRTAPRLDLVETGRWCRDVDAPGCDFKNITEAIGTADGGLLVADYRGPIRQFDRTGTFVRELSRKGAGPGEYRYVHALQISGDRLAWYDPILRRITRIALASGQAAESPAMNLSMSLGGVYLVGGGEMVAFEVPPAAQPNDTVSAVFRAVTATGASRVRATVRHPSAFVAGSPVPVAPPLFSPNTIADVGWTGVIAHSTGARYDVRVFPTTGAGWRLTVDVPPRPVLPAERDSAIAVELKDSNARTVAELPPRTQERIRRAMAHFPQVDALRVVRDGTIWIRPTPARNARTARWDVFSADGARVGFAELPLSAMVKDGTGTWVLAVVLQEDDVPAVVRYAVRR